MLRLPFNRAFQHTITTTLRITVAIGTSSSAISRETGEKQSQNANVHYTFNCRAIYRYDC